MVGRVVNVQLPDTKIASYFLKTFGRPDREKTCECERTAEANVAQMLHIANGDTLNQKLMAKVNARIYEGMKQGAASPIITLG